MEQIDNEILISLIEKNPSIWDKSSEDYKDRIKVKNAWRNVCSVLFDGFENWQEERRNEFGQLLMKKWTNMRDQWLKWKKKEIFMKISGKGVSHSRPYLYHEQMRFLEKNMEMPFTTGMTFSDIEATQEGLGEKREYDDGDSCMGTPSLARPFKKPKRGLDEFERRFLKSLETPADRHLSFFKGVIPSINFPESQIIDFQMGVLQLIRDSQLGSPPVPNQQLYPNATTHPHLFLSAPHYQSVQHHSVPQGSPSSPSPVPIAPKKQPPPQEPPEVCLKWNSYHSNMQATFPSLLNNEQFVDVTLACEGRSIKCHKVMLSACSSYFEELLSQNPCQHPIVFMRDLKFWEVQALVEFMYCGEVNVAQEKLPSLLAAAEALQIKGLTGPSQASSGQDDDTGGGGSGDTEDGHPQPQKRVRKRKSAHPIAYPIRIQSTPSPSTNGGQQQIRDPGLQVHKMKVPIMPSLASSSHLQEPAYHPPVRIKREPSSTPPLALLKEEQPLDLGIDSSERNKDDNNGQTHNSSLQDAINRLHGKQFSLNQGGAMVKAESNGGLSEDDCSVSSPPQTDPGDLADP